MTLVKFWGEHWVSILVVFVVMMFFIKYFKAETKSALESVKRFLLFLAKALGIFIAVQLLGATIFGVSLKSLKDAGAIIGILNDPSHLTPEVQKQLVALGVAALLIILMGMRVNIFTVFTDLAAKLAKLGVKTVLVLVVLAIAIVLAWQFGVLSPKKVSEGAVESSKALSEARMKLKEIEDTEEQREEKQRERQKRIDEGDLSIMPIKLARRAREEASDRLQSRKIETEAFNIQKMADEEVTKRYRWSDRFTKVETMAYDSKGNILNKIPAYTRMRIYYSIDEEDSQMVKPIFLPGFSEPLFLGTYFQEGIEQWAVFRSSHLGLISLEEHLRQIGHIGEWIEPSHFDPNVVFQRAVVLYPGEMSQVLAYTHTIEGGEYKFFRPDRSVQFMVWINGEMVHFGPSNQKLPSFKDTAAIRVRLSPDTQGVRTLRFVVTK